jgi:hypothetical protein
VIKVKATDRSAVFLLAEAIVSADEDETIVVDTQFLHDLAVQKMEQVHRTDLTIVLEK